MAAIKCRAYIDDLKKRISEVDINNNVEVRNRFYQNILKLYQVELQKYGLGLRFRNGLYYWDIDKEEMFDAYVLSSIYDLIEKGEIEVSSVFKQELKYEYKISAKKNLIRILRENIPDIKPLELYDLKLLFSSNWNGNGEKYFEEILPNYVHDNKPTAFEEIKRVLGPTLSEMKLELEDLEDIIENTLLKREIETLTEEELKELCEKVFDEEIAQETLTKEEIYKMNRDELLDKIYSKLKIQRNYQLKKEALETKREVAPNDSMEEISKKTEITESKVERLARLSMSINAYKKSCEIQTEKSTTYDNIIGSEQKKNMSSLIEEYDLNFAILNKTLKKDIEDLETSIAAIKSDLEIENKKFFKKKDTIRALQSKLIENEQKLAEKNQEQVTRKTMLKNCETKLLNMLNEFIRYINDMNIGLSYPIEESQLSYENIKNKYYKILDDLELNFITKPSQEVKNLWDQSRKDWYSAYGEDLSSLLSKDYETDLGIEKDKLEDLKKAALFEDGIDSARAQHLDKAFELMEDETFTTEEFDEIVEKRTR